MAKEEGPAPQPDKAPSRLNDVIDAWFNDHFPNSPVAQNTTAWNLTVAAREDLKQRLSKEH